MRTRTVGNRSRAFMALLRGVWALMGDMDDIIQEFLAESHEGLDKLDQELVALEKDPGDKRILATIFRIVHTIKGTCGFLGFSKLERVSHVGENLLSLLRDGRLDLNGPRTTALLALVDAVRGMLAHIEEHAAESEEDHAALIATLEKLAIEGADGCSVEPHPEVASSHAASVPPPELQLAPEVQPASGLEPVARDPVDTDSRPANHESHAASSTGADESRPSARANDGGEGKKEENLAIRVPVNLLDGLMNLVGELVLARNQILQYSRRLVDPGFLSTTQRLNLITTELQEGVMKTRMQPIGSIWSKFPRVVRDLAVVCGKKVRLEMEGKETELDRTLIEAIKDPLTHIVRNSVDHGIESPEVRRANGKPEEGVLTLRAFHEGGQVMMEIADDGGGIDPQKVRAKALSNGLVTVEALNRMAEKDLVNLVFLPGFSTAEKVTNVSGRGVGMDVVKTNIEKIGGTVDIHSRPGEGTTLRVKIPLTLAIIPALIVTCDGNRYAIPQVSLLELVLLEDEAKSRIESVHGAPVFRLRGRLLPIVYLSEVLGTGLPDRPADAPIHIVVLQAGNQSFGLIVDSVNDTEEIVVKPLSKQLGGISCFAGATIMGDGRVSLILDVTGIAETSRVLHQAHERARVEVANVAAGDRGASKRTLLVFSAGKRRLTVDLAAVDRLEEIPPSQIERSGDVDVIQYRRQIMPLIFLTDWFGETSTQTFDEDHPMQVIVRADQAGRRIGLVVDQILDIVADELDVRRGATGRGVRGSAVISGHVTDFLDIDGVIASSPAAERDLQPA